MSNPCVVSVTGKEYLAKSPTYIHEDRDHHQLRVEADKRLVFCKTMLLNKPVLDGAQEVPVKTSVNEENDDFRDLVPNIVDVHEPGHVSCCVDFVCGINLHLTWWGDHTEVAGAELAKFIQASRARPLKHRKGPLTAQGSKYT
jgi:hypothetical protein